MKNNKGLGNRPTLIFELVNIFGRDNLEYKVELPSDVVKEIFRHLCGMDKTEDDTLCQLREMLDIISVSPQCVLLDGQEEIELINSFEKLLPLQKKNNSLGPGTARSGRRTVNPDIGGFKSRRSRI